ncbi:MAG: hypothetical protein QME94_11445 [Anaerolineae bacterium]|nr:hypothetical protein [Anaerolineae bacterium]
MSLPAVVLSLVFASLYAGIFHLAFARRAAEIVRYWLAAVIGFFLGAALGLLVPWRLFVVGEVHLLEGTLICTSALFLAHWLGGGQARAA